MTVRLDEAGKTIFKTNYARLYGKLATGMFNSKALGNTPSDTERYNPATGKYDIPISIVNNQTNFAVDPGLRNGDAAFAQTNTVVRPRTFTFGVRYQF